MQVTSFSAQMDDGCQVLVLGSMPGIKSLVENQYYAHPRNAFWPIMAELGWVSASTDYSQRLTQLKAAGLGLWDVYQQCYREGSLDSAIDKRSAKFNSISQLSDHYPIQAIACNGGAAFKAFNAYCKQEQWDLAAQGIELFALPSTSPAYAAMSFAEKLERWRVLQPFIK